MLKKIGSKINMVDVSNQKAQRYPCYSFTLITPVGRNEIVFVGVCKKSKINFIV